MILLAGADLVLPDRLIPSGSLIIDGDRIVTVESRVIDTPRGATRIDLSGFIIVPGFIDVHVHGVQGVDVLDGGNAVADAARRLPRYGVTAFCPTSLACAPAALDAMLTEIDRMRKTARPHAAHVVGAHLESNFINAEYNGAQPVECLRLPPSPASDDEKLWRTRKADHQLDFDGQAILDAIAAHRGSVSIITIAPELDGGLDLVKELSAAGHRVSIGHSGATYEQTLAAVDAGVCHATHLFNRMSPMLQRAPGVAGAVLRTDRVAAEVICDGFHVHPALIDLAIRAKGPQRIIAITDGTAGSGLPVGSRARLGQRPIIVTSQAAELEDGTLAGSVLTMDGALRTLVHGVGVPLVAAVLMCATTPAQQLGLTDRGHLAIGAVADLAVLGPELTVHATYVAGQLWRNTADRADV
jgi:N-acetylglucosamine-6-phosphate deacetylase